MTKIGITFGCFIPLHKGHISMIDLSLKDNDITVIGVCGYDEDRGENFIPYRKRCELVTEIYKNNKNVKVVYVDDKKLGLDGTFTLENWTSWCNEIFQNSEINPQNNDYDITWYFGEDSYFDKISKLYPTHHFCLLNRDEIKISGTEIRKNVEKYADFIHPRFLKYLKGEKI